MNGNYHIHLMLMFVIFGTEGSKESGYPEQTHQRWLCLLGLSGHCNCDSNCCRVAFD